MHYLSLNRMIKKISSLLCFVFACITVTGQQLQDSLLNEWHTRYPQEKIYMQLDKSFYRPGETIWFKAYIFSGALPSQVSKTMYAELLNKSGTLLQRKTMPVVQAGAASFFDIPDTLSQPGLYIRAYTAWMLNFDPSFLHIKPVNIISAGTAAQHATRAIAYTLSLFPEGGDLVENIACRVAFKTNDQDGKPFAVNGTITDASGNTLGNFSSTHNGMGFFSIAATEGVTYKAVWKDPKGIQHETILPNAKSRTAALSIIQESGQALYTIIRPGNAPEELQQYTVLAQMQQQTVYAARINLTMKTTVTAPIPTDSLPDGIMQVTLFNKLQEPVAERIVFVNNHSYSFITDLHLVEKNHEPRSKNVIQIDVGGWIKSNLSVAVTDAALDMKGPQENIFSQLLLTSDIKGYVHDPAYYFSSDEDSVKQQLDLVMMTNGWRRFNWQDLMANKWPVINYPPDNYLSIQGNIFGLSAPQLQDKSITGILKTGENSGTNVVTIPVNKDGSFKLDGVYFFDTLKIFYQLSNDKNKTLSSLASFSFNNGMVKSPPLSAKTLAAVYLPPAPPEDMASKMIRQSDLYLAQVKQQKVKLLQTVTVTGTQRSLAQKLDKEYASGLFSNGNARVFATEDDPSAQSAMSILDYLRGKVPGLQISTDGASGGSISRRGSTTDVFLDEMNTDISLLQSTPMSNVAMIKVFDPPFFGSAGGGAGGAVAVYTKKGTGNNAGVTGLDAYTLYGYSPIKEFYAPNYEADSKTVEADYRSTLYWNPFLLMDAKNKRITIPFYNNDSAKSIRVIIEGINESGKLTREEKVFE